MFVENLRYYLFVLCKYFFIALCAAIFVLHYQDNKCLPSSGSHVLVRWDHSKIAVVDGLYHVVDQQKGCRFIGRSVEVILFQGINWIKATRKKDYPDIIKILPSLKQLTPYASASLPNCQNLKRIQYE